MLEVDSVGTRAADVDADAADSVNMVFWWILNEGEVVIVSVGPIKALAEVWAPERTNSALLKRTLDQDLSPNK